jgi:hypothetical protein
MPRFQSCYLSLRPNSISFSDAQCLCSDCPPASSPLALHHQPPQLDLDEQDSSVTALGDRAAFSSVSADEMPLLEDDVVPMLWSDCKLHRLSCASPSRSRIIQERSPARVGMNYVPHARTRADVPFLSLFLRWPLLLPLFSFSICHGLTFFQSMYAVFVCASCFCVSLGEDEVARFWKEAFTSSPFTNLRGPVAAMALRKTRPNRVSPMPPGFMCVTVVRCV